MTVIGIAVALAGCATQRAPVEDARTSALLNYLQPGGPTRTDVEGRLGPPAQTYENGRVVTYLLETRDSLLTATNYSVYPGYTLVIEYAQDGRVARRAMVSRPGRD